MKKGVYEDDVDAAGGEIKQGCEEFVTRSPEDLKETLMHIAVKSNDSELVNWLDAHSKSHHCHDHSHSTNAFSKALNQTNGTPQVLHHSILPYCMEQPTS